MCVCVCVCVCVCAAWESFLSPLENSATQADTNSGNQLTNEYYTFLIHCLEGEIIRFITPGELQEILDHLITNSVIDDLDKEDILSMNRQTGLMHLFTIMKQCHEWPLKLFSAFRAAKPELLRKIDPMGESPCKCSLSLSLPPSLLLSFPPSFPPSLSLFPSLSLSLFLPLSLCLSLSPSLSLSLSFCLSLGFCFCFCLFFSLYLNVCVCIYESLNHE